MTAYDPIVTSVPEFADLAIAPSWADAVSDADATLVVTEWDEFLSMNLATLADKMTGDLFVDARNAFNVAAVTDAGLNYIGIGRAAQPLQT